MQETISFQCIVKKIIPSPLFIKPIFTIFSEKKLYKIVKELSFLEGGNNLSKELDIPGEFNCKKEMRCGKCPAILLMEDIQ